MIHYNYSSRMGVSKHFVIWYYYVWVPVFLQLRARVRSTMEDIVRKALGGKTGMADSILGKPAKPTKFDCYKPAVRRFAVKCFKFSEVCKSSSPHYGTSGEAWERGH